MTDQPATLAGSPAAEASPPVAIRKGISVSPWITQIIGILLSAGFALLCAKLGEWAFFWFSNANHRWWFIPFFLLLCSCFGSAYGGGQGFNLPTGWKGVFTFLGERIPWFLLNEGRPWVFPFNLGGVKGVNTKRDTSTPKEIELLSKDGLKMRVRMVFERLVVDPYTYLSAQDPEGSIYEIAQTALREVFPEHDGKDLIKTTVRGPLAAEMKSRVDPYDCEYGLDITHFFEPEILPPQDILDALAKIQREILEAEAEKIEIDAVRERVRELLKDEIKVELAYEIVQAERNKSTTVRQIHRFEGLQSPLEALTTLLLTAAGKQPLPAPATTNS